MKQGVSGKFIARYYLNRSNPRIVCADGSIASGGGRANVVQENAGTSQQTGVTTGSSVWGRRSPDGRRLSSGIARLRWDRQQAIASLAVLSVVLAALGVGLLFYASSHQSRMYEGVSVAGVDLSGMTRSQARAALEPVLTTYAQQPIELTGAEGDFTVVPAEAGMRFDIDATVDRAYAYGRTGNLLEHVARWSRAMLHGSDVRPVYVIDTATLDQSLSGIAQQIVTAPQDAFIQMNEQDEPAIVPEVNGISFDLTATRGLVIQRFASLSTDPVPMILPVAFPNVAAGAVSEALVIEGPDGRAWRISTGDLRSIVSFSANDGELRVNEGALETLVSSLATSVNRDASDAAVYVNNRDEIVVRQAVDARDVDVSASVDAIRSAIVDGTRGAALVIDTTPATIGTTVAQAAADQANALVRDGLELTWTGGSKKMTPRELLAALTIAVDPSADEPFTLGFDQGILTSVLTPLFESINDPAVNASLRLVDGKIKVVEKSKSGTVVDVDSTVENIRTAALDQKPSAVVELVDQKPEFTEKNASKIKLDDTLATGSTYYGNSSDQRRQNVERAVELEDGWLVAPGEVFSFVDFVGGISEKEGFAVGFGIVSNGQGGVTTAPVVGVSTTLFHAVFWAGLPVVERYTHPYWINSYGEPPSGMLGLDAMVDVQPDYALDFKFQNTTDNWIAVVMEADGTNVVVKILGTNPRWTIQVGEPVITDIQTPDTTMNYEDSPELPKGEERQVESAAQGFTATITRTVSLDGEVLSEDTFAGTYAPSRNTTLRGTGED
jgi:vancomycin resistance protein YoaR